MQLGSGQPENPTHDQATSDHGATSRHVSAALDTHHRTAIDSDNEIAINDSKRQRIMGNRGEVTKQAVSSRAIPNRHSHEVVGDGGLSCESCWQNQGDKRPGNDYSHTRTPRYGIRLSSSASERF